MQNNANSPIANLPKDWVSPLAAPPAKRCQVLLKGGDGGGQKKLNQGGPRIVHIDAGCCLILPPALDDRAAKAEALIKSGRSPAPQAVRQVVSRG